MKLLITWLKRNGNCRYWTNSKKVEQAAMSLVCLRGAIERMAEEDGISFDEAWEKYFKTINDEHQISILVYKPEGEQNEIYNRVNSRWLYRDNRI